MVKRKLQTIEHDMYASDYESTEYLCINNCGSQLHDRDNAIVSRPQGRQDYHLLFITGGECVARINDSEVVAKKGDMLFYRPHEPQWYCFGDSRCTSFWLHLSGTGVPNMCAEAGLGVGNFFHLNDLADIELAHMKLIVETQSKQRGYEKFVQSYTELIFACIYRQLPDKEPSLKTRADERIVKVLNEMDRLYYHELDIDNYARMCGVSRDRFMHLFKSVVGLPPQKYITNVRINNAKRYLIDNDLTVAEVAERCGFADAMYFSRVFHKQTGLSPTEYRRAYKK